MPVAGNVRVDKMLPGFDFGLPENSFLFLTVCDTRSVLERKNPLGAVKAFRTVFTDDRRASLVIKMNTAHFQQAELDRVREEMSGCENIFLIDSVLTRAQMNALLKASDCVVSLHRAEGFGLVPAEAMSLGKPVIVTAWSGSADYIRPDNCAAIGYELVTLGKDYGPYKANQSWAEPDLDEAAQWMRRLVEEPELAL